MDKTRGRKQQGRHPVAHNSTATRNGQKKHPPKAACPPATNPGVASVYMFFTDILVWLLHIYVCAHWQRHTWSRVGPRLLDSREKVEVHRQRTSTHACAHTQAADCKVAVKRDMMSGGRLADAATTVLDPDAVSAHQTLHATMGAPQAAGPQAAKGSARRC